MDSLHAITMFLVSLCGWDAADYAGDVASAARRYDLDPRLVAATMWRESRCDPDATSAKGAVGLMQLKPRTWATAGYDRLTEAQLRRPALNILLGARHLRRCLDRCGGFLAGALGLYSGLRKSRRTGQCRASAYSDDILARMGES